MIDKIQKRPFKEWGNLNEIGCSNNKEDEFVINYFKDNHKKKVLVDAGAADGVTGSNSFKLINEYGWSAILIEPFKPFYDFLTDLYENNKKVQIFNYALDIEEYETKIYFSNEKAAVGLTSLNKNDPWGLPLIEKQNVLTKTFNNLIKEYNIDFLSIDCEQKDFKILKSINFDIFNIIIICIEKSDKTQYNDEIINFLENKNYVLSLTTNHNFIFVKREKNDICI